VIHSGYILVISVAIRLLIKYYNTTMKIITLQEVGYNHPRSANWSYNIWSINLIDTEKEYNQSITCRSTFEGEDRFISLCKQELDLQVIIVRRVSTKTGLPSVTGVQGLPIIDSAKSTDGGLWCEIVNFLE